LPVAKADKLRPEKDKLSQGRYLMRANQVQAESGARARF
jgi:hypothetical protein